MSVTREQDGRPPAGSRSRRRPRQEAPRPRTVRFDLTEAEFAELEQAASRAGLAKGAYAAEAALAAATGHGRRAGYAVPGGAGRADPRRRPGPQDRRPSQPGGREAERDRAASRRAGPCAQACLRRVERLDAAAEQVRRTLR